jgi:predicted anti-sigma-YlaC factor YlaD
MASSDLSCKEFVEIVTDYLEGKLSQEEKALIDAHLASCEGCCTYLEQMQQTIRYLGELPDEEITEEARNKLLRAFREWNRG